MNKKTILMSVVFAILVGIVFGVIIGGLSGMFLSPNSLDKDTKPSVEIANEADSLSAEEEAKKKAEQEAEAKALIEAEKQSQETQNQPNPQPEPQQPQAQPTPQPQVQQPQQTPQAPQTSQGVVATGNGQTLNVRASSDPGSAIISSAGDGSALTIYERANGMVRVKTSTGVEGWVSEQYIAG